MIQDRNNDQHLPLIFERLATAGYCQDLQCHVALLSITALAEGQTLTSAEAIIFAELVWTPGIILQCEANMVCDQNILDLGENIFRNCLNNSLSISIEHSVAGSVLCGLASGNMIEHPSIYPSFPPHNHSVMLITLAIDLFGFADELILGSGPCPSHWSEGLRSHPVPIAGWFCSRQKVSSATRRKFCFSSKGLCFTPPARLRVVRLYIEALLPLLLSFEPQLRSGHSWTPTRSHARRQCQVVKCYARIYDN